VTRGLRSDLLATRQASALALDDALNKSAGARPKDVLKLLLTSLENEQDPDACMHVLGALKGLRPRWQSVGSTYLRALRRQSGDTDGLLAAAIAQTFPVGEVASDLVALYSEIDDQYGELEYLLEKWGEEGTPSLIAVLTSDNPAQRRLAAVLLGQLGAKAKPAIARLAEIAMKTEEDIWRFVSTRSTLYSG